MKKIIVFFIFSFSILYGSFVTPLNSHAKIDLQDNIAKQYNVKWFGSEKKISNDVWLANDNNGTIQFIRKTDNYQSPLISIKVKEGHINQTIQLDTSSFYKCIDEECINKSFEVSLKFKENGKTLKIEQAKYTGTLKEKNGSVYLDGYGSLETNTSQFYGEFLDNKFSGYGKFTTNKSSITIQQDGLWQEGKFKQGFLKTIFLDGTLYSGQSINGVADGFGNAIWTDGSSYSGYFKDGKRDGSGTYLYSDGSVYLGDYANDEKNGYGELYIVSKDIVYKGYFKNGNFDGNGALYYGKENIAYVGQFKNNQPNGTGYLIDKDNNKLKVIYENGNLLFYEQAKVKYSFFQNFIDNFPVSQAHAGMFDFVSNMLNKAFDAFRKAKQWVETNKEHIVNAVKGCVAGASGGAVVGAAGGAVAGSIIPGAGTAVGAGIGAVTGGLNGCINQGKKAWDISKESGGVYTLEDAKKAFADEISIENFVYGSAAGVFGAALLFRGVSAGALVGTSKIISKAFKKLCKYKPFKFLCKKELPSKPITVVSWNLKNLSSKSSKSYQRDWKTIKNYISSQKSVDFILLQEIMDKNALKRIANGTVFTPILSKAKGKKGKKEYYGFLVNKLFLNKVKLLNFSQYTKFRVPPSVLLVKKQKLALINVHIVFGNNKMQRIKEVKNLKEIIKKLKKQYKVEKIIVAGDFNLEWNDIIPLSGYLSLTPYINDKTSVGMKQKQRFNKSYDHFLVNTVGKANVDSYVFTNRKQPYFRQQVSDHLPINGAFFFKSKKKKKK